jgi:hypothetical protein
MKRAIRIAMVAAAIAAAVVFLTPSAAQAQVRVEGRFRLPHGDIAIGVGDPYYDRYYDDIYYGAPAYPIGSYVPYGYRVIEDPYFGQGFYSPVFVCRAHHVRHAHWIPVRRYSRRWVVIERPIFGPRYYSRRDGRRYDRRYTDRRYSDRWYGDRRYGDRRYGDSRYRRQSDGRYSGDTYSDRNRQYWDPRPRR